MVDNRVAKICKKNGIKDCEIFYSPISTWFLVISLILFYGGSGCLILFYLYSFNKFLILITIPYFFISFFLFSKLSNSFAITSDKIIVINPNFPFKKFKEYNKNQINKITIDSSNNMLYIFFLVFEQNYLIIETQNKQEKFYCIGLGIDAFDENWTEKTLDDLNYALSKDNIVTEFKF